MRLILMRHAKSDWSSAAGSDHARPLNPRGERSAKAMGDWLRDKGYLPTQVLCSTATRTRQTLDLLALDAPVEFQDQMYNASAHTLMDSLECATGETVLMIGHNPGIAGFAARLLPEPVAHPRFLDYPTCATLVADFATEGWEDVDFGMGIEVDFIVPRDLL